ncbi:MAG: amidase [Bryobacteraceae bacterium]|nr:amidase [Bryobacteraceae bacterium]
MIERPGLLFASIADLSEQIRRGQVSPVALTEHCLRRIEALNPRLNAFITVTAALAREQARQAESEIRAGRWRGPLHGLPAAIKDFYDTAGIRTTAAFEHFKNRVPSEDAEMVVRLRDAGGVLMGKTNMHRLGMGTTSLESAFGAVVNRRSAEHVAGGSSGGSAAAVAAGLCFATVDTDAIGSGRLPAAICGVTCYKPTFGVLSTAGILAGEKPEPAILLLSHPCITARTAEDVMLVFSVLSQAAKGDAASIIRFFQDHFRVQHIGVATNFVASDDVKAAFHAAVSRIASMGIEMIELRIPFEEASFDISTIEEDRAAINSAMFGHIDAIALPTLTAPTPTVGEARASGDLAVSADNTFFCNYYGLPAISVPCGVDRNGLPLGLQFIGPRGGDGQVLSVARAYQEASGWRYTPPESMG